MLKLDLKIEYVDLMEDYEIKYIAKQINVDNVNVVKDLLNWLVRYEMELTMNDLYFYTDYYTDEEIIEKYHLNDYKSQEVSFVEYVDNELNYDIINKSMISNNVFICWDDEKEMYLLFENPYN